MDVNKKDKRTEKKKGSLIGIIIVIAAAVAGANNTDTDAIPFILIIAAVAVAVAAVAEFAKKGKQTAAKKTSDRMDAYTPAARKYSAPTPVSSSVKDNCDYGADNCEYSHDEARRVQQLNDFLRNGTIDKAEYRVLLERYRKEAKAAEYHRS